MHECVDRCCAGVAWHPEAMLQSMDEGTTVSLATASADTTACLWSADGKKLHTLTGHTDR